MKLQQKYQAAVTKAAKKMVAAPIAAERAEIAAADSSLELAIKRRGTVVSAISIVPPVPVDEDAVAEKELAQKQTVIKLCSVKSRINKLKKDVSFSG